MQNTVHVWARMLLAMLFLGMVTSTAKAVVVLEYVADNSQLTGGNAIIDAGGFTAGDPNQIMNDVDYVGPTIYGQHDISTEASIVQNFNSLDMIRFRPGAVGEAALILFKEDDFINGATSSNAVFAGSDTVTLDIRDIDATFNAGGNAGRLILRQGSSYFASNEVFTISNETVNPTALSYFAYDPATDFKAFGADSTSSVVVGGEIANVTEVGFWYEATGASAAVADRMQYQAIEVNMTVIPEPSTFALVVMALGGLYFLRRRQK